MCDSSGVVAVSRSICCDRQDMATKKRQHFVPKFLLRRFAATGGRWQGHIFRLDKASGRCRSAVPRTEAAKNRYYDLPEDAVGEFQPESILEKIESGGAAAIQRLERGETLDPANVIWLAYFSALQTSRTPLDRAERRYLDGVMAAQMEEIRFSAPEKAVAFLRDEDPTLTEDQAEAKRRRLVDDLGSGRIRIESTADREIAGMFLGLNDAVTQLASQCDWVLVKLPNDGPPLVLPDTGYTRYDPSPRVPGTGSGFLGTNTVETVIPVSPRAALVIVQGSGQTGTGSGTVAYAEDLNLRAYAQTQTCIYGTTQQDVVAVQQLAGERSADLAARRRYARTLWIHEHTEGEPEQGPFRFIGYSLDGERSELFDVDPRAREGRRGVTPDDMWP